MIYIMIYINFFIFLFITCSYIYFESYSLYLYKRLLMIDINIWLHIPILLYVCECVRACVNKQITQKSFSWIERVLKS